VRSPIPIADRIAALSVNHAVAALALVIDQGGNCLNRGR
jgi:hypothetical protein